MIKRDENRKRKVIKNEGIRRRNCGYVWRHFLRLNSSMYVFGPLLLHYRKV